MNLLDTKTMMALKEYAKKRKESKVKSPNMAVSGVTGKGDYPVKPAVPDKNKSARGFKVGPEYFSPEAKRKRAEEAKVRQMKEESRGGDRYGFTPLG